MFSVPLAALIFLTGLLWQQKIPTEPDPDLAADETERDQMALDYAKAVRRRAIILLVRLALMAVGLLIFLANLIAGMGALADAGGFATLTALYGGILLLVQRSEVNRRLATLYILAILGLLVNNYGVYRGWEAENRWAVLAALGLNYLFWLLVGRRYPPGSSSDIHVWGMDE